MTAYADDAAVVTIDCHYIHPLNAAAFLLVEEGGAAFVENNTAHAVPLLMEALADHGLDAGQVRHIIITHLHFDHAGGTSALAKLCPNAEVLCHPVAVRHLIDPSRLVQSVKQVYGQQHFEELYGAVEPIEAGRVRAVEDGEALALGGRTLTFLHTPGHARHHIVVHDSKSQAVFTGDAFGLMHTSPARSAEPCLVFSSPPTNFDPAQARDSIHRIRATGAKRLYLTHFGTCTNLDRGQAQILESIDALEAVLEAARATELEGQTLQAFCDNGIRRAFEAHFARWNVPMADEDWDWLAMDMSLDAAGLAHCVERGRRG